MFRHQLALIQSEYIREAVAKTLEKAPSYFWEMPASTSGKYHPVYSLGKGGLIRHTKAAIKIACCLLELNMYATLRRQSKDEIIAALILHDCAKKGLDGSEWTVLEHPLCAAKLFEEVCSDYIFDKEMSEEDMTSFLCRTKNITNIIRSHMGQWDSDKMGNKILPRPITKEEKFVHQCDYLASKRFIIIEELD